METYNVCRTCLQICKADEITSVNQLSDDLDVTLHDKLAACVPELAIDIVPNPVICETCSGAITSAYKFKIICMRNEKTIYKYIQQRKEHKYDLLTSSDLFNLAKKHIDDEHSYSCIDKIDRNSEVEGIELFLIQSSLSDIVMSRQTNSDVEASKTDMGDGPQMQNELPPVETGEGSGKESVVPESPGKTLSNDKPNHVKVVVEKVASLEVISEAEKAPKNVQEPAGKIEEKSVRKPRKQAMPKIRPIGDLAIASTSSESCVVLAKSVEKPSKTNSEKNNLERLRLIEELEGNNDDEETFLGFPKSNEKSVAVNTQIDKEEPKQKEKIAPQLFSSPRLKKRKASSKSWTNSHPADTDMKEIKKSLGPSKRTRRRTARYQTESKRFQCAKCDKSYTFKSHFEVHLRSHIITKRYVCPICEKDFAQEKYLKSHAALHTATSGSYQCNICLKSLSATTALERHYRTHTGEKPYPCQFCSKKFSQKIQLSVHTRTHTGQKPFACNICQAEFTQKTHLLGHVRIHTGEKPFKCKRCPKTFRKVYALRIHEHSHSVKPYQCKCCNFLFKDRDVFQRHVRKHLIRINTTGSYLLKKSKPKDHVKIEEDADVTAYLMDNISKHERDVATNVKSQNVKKMLYKCTVCPKGFTRKYTLMRHMKVHDCSSDEDSTSQASETSLSSSV